MPLKGIYVFPHGALSLIPGQYPIYNGLEEINKSCFKLSNEIYNINPEVIFLITPHGISLENNFGVYLNNYAKGSAEWKGAYKDFHFEGIIDSEIAKNLLYYLQQNGNKAEGIVSYAEDEYIPLRWGEVIPLWYINQAYTNNSIEAKTFPKLIILSLPRKRNLINFDSDKKKIINNNDFKHLSYNENNYEVDFLKECHKFGRSMGEFCNENIKNFIMIVSGDLAHKHVFNYKNVDKFESVNNNREIFSNYND